MIQIAFFQSLFACENIQDTYKSIGFTSSSNSLFQFGGKKLRGKEFEVERNIAWEALVEVFKPYPKATINEEIGVIETEELRGFQVWQPAHQKKQEDGIIYYSLKAVLTEEPPYVFVKVKKTIKRKRDFFSKMEAVASDFLEEQMLLYRMGREIQVKRLIQKIYKEES